LISSSMYTPRYFAVLVILIFVLSYRIYKFW